MRTRDTMHTRNKKTDEHESIAQTEIRLEDWGLVFFVESELDAFKAAYLYRLDTRRVEVDYAKGAEKWMVTVFKEGWEK